VNQPKQEPYLTRPFIVLSFINFLVYSIFYLLMTVVASYSMDVLHSQPWVAGLAAGCFLLAALMGRLLTGRYIEAWGKRRMVMVGTVFYVLMMPLYYFAHQASFLVALRLLHGIGLGISTAALTTIVVNILPRGRQGEGLSTYTLSAMLAMAVGPMIGIFLYHSYGFRAILNVCMVQCVLILISLAVSSIPDLPVDPEKLKEFGSGFSGLFEKSALPLSFVGTLMYLSYSGLTGFIAPYARNLNLTRAGGLFFVVYSVVIILSRPPMGRLYDHKGKRVIIPTYFIFAIGLFLLSAAQLEWHFLVAAVLIGFGFGNFNTLARAIIVKPLPSHKLGIATSTYLAISEIGSGFGPFLQGLFLPMLGYRRLYFSLGIIVLIAFMVYRHFYGISFKDPD
jgi:MFS family permease